MTRRTRSGGRGSWSSSPPPSSTSCAISWSTPRRVVSKSEILNAVWDYDFEGDANIVETYISYLRKKIDRFEPPLVHTIRRVGYSLREPRP